IGVSGTATGCRRSETVPWRWASVSASSSARTSGMNPARRSSTRSVSATKRASSPRQCCILFGAVDKRAVGGIAAVGGRQPEQRHVVAALEMLALGLETGAALLVDEPGHGVGEAALGIALALAALGFEEQCPARAEALEHVVRARRSRDQL